ncbi:hypothetical protein [Streptomyces sp. NPDC088727]|uniref:hypothetical protein n=1 Tax=Streptomyces sp. NPDC088727 TaxID=3365875 RepID=UPI003827163B
MVPAQQAGENPFKTNMPATAIRGVPLPELASVQNLYGASVNGLRIATHALYLGWHIEAWKCWTDRFTLRKYGRGYLRLVLSSSGRIIRADTQRQYLTPNTAHVLTYLEEK